MGRGVMHAVVPAALAVGFCLVLWGCPDRPPELDAFFVRQGLVVTGGGPDLQVFCRDWHVFPGADKNRKAPRTLSLPGHRRLALFPWQPGKTYRLCTGGLQQRLVASQRPSPLEITVFDLESLRPHGSGAPDTEVRFSPDGRLLAIGSFEGYLRIGEVTT